MKNGKEIRWIGIIAFGLCFVLEITTDIWFGSQLPGYNWKSESLSYLGQSGSPLEHGILVWGILFTTLITLFDYTFYQVYKSKKWVLTATLFLLIYGLGEGFGSGFFPINPPDTIITLDGKLHNIFSGIGDAGLVLLPFVLMLMFPKKGNRKLHLYLWSVVGVGLIMATSFLIAKYDRPDNFILTYKGVWQRLYIFNYYFMLLILSLKMAKKLNSNDRIITS